MLTLNKYCEAVPDFALYLSFAKSEVLLYNIIDKHFREDLYQIIAESILSQKTDKERNRYLKKQMYYFASRMLNYKKPLKTQEQRNKTKYYYKAKNEHACDVCQKTSHHYHYKNFIYNKLVCKLCYNKLKRQDKKRNNNQSL